jgi:hypothetical protein
MSEIIDVRLKTKNIPNGWACNTCGRWTEKVDVVAEAADENGATIFRVCERCLAAGDIDARLAAHAARFEAVAARIRALIGRVRVPDLVAWETMTERVSVAHFAAYCMGSAHGDFDPRVDAEHARVMSDDAAFARWRNMKLEFDAARRRGEWMGEIRVPD